MRTETRIGQNIKSILPEPIVLKTHPDYGIITQIDAGYDKQQNFRPKVIFRFFEKHEIEILSFSEWDNLGTAFVKFVKCSGEPESQLHHEIGKNFYATRSEYIDRNKKSHWILLLTRNGKSMKLFRETVEKMCDSIYDSMTPRVHKLFCTRPEESKQKVRRRLFAENKENEENTAQQSQIDAAVRSINDIDIII